MAEGKNAEWLQHTIDTLEVFLEDEFDICTDFDPNGEDEYWFSDDGLQEVITINSNHSLEEQVNILAHEAGHVLLRADEKHSFKFPDQDSSTQEGRLEVFREEVLAWEKGRELLFSMNLYYDVDSWIRSYRKALINYAKWVANEPKKN